MRGRVQHAEDKREVCKEILRGKGVFFSCFSYVKIGKMKFFRFFWVVVGRCSAIALACEDLEGSYRSQGNIATIPDSEVPSIGWECGVWLVEHVFVIAAYGFYFSWFFSRICWWLPMY